MPVTDEYTVSINLQARNQAALGAINQTNRALRQQQTEMGGIANGLRNIDSRFNAIQNAIGAGFLGVSVAGVVQFAGHLVSAGREASRAQAMFESFSERIGDTASMMERLRAVTRGAIDDTSLQNAANSMLSMGLAQNADDLERLTNIGVTFAQAMGQDVGSSLENLGMLLANQSYLRLDTLGISSSQVRELATQYRAAGMDSSEAFTAAFMEVAEGMMPQMSAIADSAVSSIDRLETKLRNLYEVASRNFATGIVSIVELAEAAANYEPGRQADIARQMADLQSIVITRAMNSLGPGAIMMPDNAEWITATVRNIIDQSTTGRPYDLNDPNLPVALWNQVGMGAAEDNTGRVNAIRAAVNAMRDYYAISRSVAGSQAELETVMTDTADALADYARQTDNAIAYQRIMTLEMVDTARAVPMFRDQIAAIQEQRASFSAFEAAYANFNTSAALGFGDVANAEELQTFYQRWAELDASIRNTRDVFGELLPDDINARLTDAADSMRIWMERAQAARDAYDDMTLDVALLRGENVDELQAGIYSQLDLSELPEDRREAVLRALQLGSGEQSLSGAAFEDVTLGRIQGMVERGVSPERIAEEVRRASVLMRGLRMQGLSDAEMASALEMPIGAAAQQYGIDLSTSMVTDYLANMQEAENVATRIDSTLALTPGYGEQLATNLDAAFAQRRTLTIDLDVNTASIRGELANLIREIVGNSNGAVPGASTRRGRSSIER